MYSNPYSDQNFFSFFAVLAQRLWAAFKGELGWQQLVSDEIQLIVLIAIAFSGALVGTLLMLKRMTMLANALSHTILLGIVLVYLLFQSLSFPLLMIAALLTALLTTFLTEFLHRVIKLQEDASIGLIFSLFFALGIALLSFFSRNVHAGTELIMGNVDALQRGEVMLVLTVLGINTALLLFLYQGFKIVTFDPLLARAFGFSPVLFNYLIMIQASAMVIGSLRAVGVLMVLAFLVLPPLTARLLTPRLAHLLLVAAGIGALSALAGVALSRHLLTCFGVGLSTAGITVLLLGFFYLTAILSKSYLSKRAPV